MMLVGKNGKLAIYYVIAHSTVIKAKLRELSKVP